MEWYWPKSLDEWLPCSHSLGRGLPGVHDHILVNVLCTTVRLSIVGRHPGDCDGLYVLCRYRLFWFFVLIYTHKFKFKNFRSSPESNFTLIIFSHIQWWKKIFFLRPFGFWSGNSRILHQTEVNAGGSTFTLRNAKNWTFHENVDCTLE